jgi:hypothetical protein
MRQCAPVNIVVDENNPMKCPCCDTEVEPHEMDVAFGLPDAIFCMPKEQRQARAKTHSDFCSLDETRYFIRGVAYVLVQRLNTNFGWGVWAEVPRETFYRYHEIYDRDGTNEAPAAGVLANTPADYLDVPQPLEIHFGPPDKRPTFKFGPSEGQLYLEQANGMEVEKWHSIVDRYVR